MKKLFALALVLVMALSLAACSSPGSPGSSGTTGVTERWEYTRLIMDYGGKSRQEEFISEANELGAEGWELVSAYVTANSSPSHYFIFKRRLP